MSLIVRVRIKNIWMRVSLDTNVNYSVYIYSIPILSLSILQYKVYRIICAYKFVCTFVSVNYV